jgi:hypothetical protein
MGLLHALANSPAPIGALSPGCFCLRRHEPLHADTGSPLAELFAQCKGKSPEERSKLLETDTSLEAAHSSAASTGQTAAPAAEAKVDLHFAGP